MPKNLTLLMLLMLISPFLVLYYADLVWAENWALLVGINDYKYNSIGISDLKYCENDVDLFKETLIKYANFREENIKILKSEEATKKNIKNGFLEWLVVNAKPGDKVIFYFSGHGVQFKDYDGDEEDGLDEFLVAHDSASLDIYFISDDELGEWLSKINTFDKTVILDCNHSGGVIRDMPSDVILLSACKEDQICMETPSLKHGVFTYYLTKAFASGASGDRNGDGKITWDKLVEQATRDIQTNRWKQDPQLGPDVNLARHRVIEVEEKWGLLIGINQYENPLIRPLQYAVADAMKIYNVLVDPQYGGFSRDKVVLLTDNTKEKPTDEVILRYLGWLSLHADVADTVFIYFSGHCYNDGEKSYLISQNAKIENLGGTTITAERFNAVIKRFKAKTLIVIFDTTSYPGEVSTSGMENIIIYASCKPGGASFEWPEKGHGVFTHYLLEALRGAADKDKDGYVMFSEVATYVEENVKKWARQMGKSQTPQIVYQRGSALIPLTKETKNMK